jgi:hypothetical protein
MAVSQRKLKRLQNIDAGDHAIAVVVDGEHMGSLRPLTQP